MSCPCEVPYIGPSLANTCYGGFILFMSVLDNVIRRKCDISEVCQRVTPRSSPDAEYDFVVIGGGASGSVVAGRLSEDPKFKVLLIEAGGHEPPASQVPSMMGNFLGNSYVDWNYQTEPQEKACLGYPERRCKWPRGKVLGGTGVLHGMMYMRGVPEDYDNWEKMGNYGWGYEDVTSVFKKSEGNLQVGKLVDGELHGTKGPMVTTRFPDQPELALDMMEAAKELGYNVVDDLNKRKFTGFTIAQANVINGTRVSSARAYLRPARNRPNFHVMINSTVTKITLKPNKKTISEVEFIYQTRSFSVKVKKEAIISAGAINSPQILLLSGIGPKEELDKVNIKQIHNLPGVGKNLHNHVSFGVDFRLDKKAVNELDWSSVVEYLDYRRGPMSSTGMAQVTARLTTKYGDPSGENPDLQLFFGGLLANCSRFGSVNEVDIPGNKTFTISPVVLRPRSRGYIGLKTNNPLDPPLMQPNYLTHFYDVKMLVAGIRIAQSLGKTKVLKEKYRLEIVQDSYGDCSKKNRFDSDKFWECAVRFKTSPENHQAGSCKMGPSSDSLAVVDSQLRVHGVEGLRVMDASVMPEVVSGNPHATCVMIAEKGVESIRKKWSNKA